MIPRVLVRTLVSGVTVLLLGSGVAFAAQGVPGGGPPGGEATGNNLSFPAIWAEGVAKVLRGTPGMTPVLSGAWWWWWGTDPNDETIPLSCAPDPDDMDFCDDGKEVTFGAVPGTGAIRVYLQQDSLNTWQADNADWSAAPVSVDWIDWGDNLESSNFTLRSQVRVEVVLLKDLDPLLPMLQYGMRHVYGWGQSEMHGVATTGTEDAPIAEALAGLQATVYSHCARLTIQRLAVPREELLPGTLTWVTSEGWLNTDPTAPSLIAPPIFNLPVYQGGDGRGYYAAEINVKGKIVYGYTWNVRRLNDGVGDYRITFSLDPYCPAPLLLNTYFVEGVTEILLPLEEVEAEAEPTTGATAVLDFTNNLTYMDVRILPQKGGKKTK